MTLRVVPITVKRALPWIVEHHSHLDKPNGGILAAAVANDDELVCVAIADHPARLLMDGFTLNVSRVASDGTRHAASKCIAAISRAALALGYLRILSYTLLGEAGHCYRAAGWWPTAVSAGGDWGRPSRPREPAEQAGEKVRWEFGPRALAKNLCLCGHAHPRACEVLIDCSDCGCETYRDIEAFVASCIGRVPLRGRCDNLPLFGGNP